MLCAVASSKGRGSPEPAADCNKFVAARLEVFLVEISAR
jgi:hypothetical protein